MGDSDREQSDDSEDEAFQLQWVHSGGRAARHAARQRIRSDINTWHRMHERAIAYVGHAKRIMRLLHTAPHLSHAIKSCHSVGTYQKEQWADYQTLCSDGPDRRRCPASHARLIDVQRSVYATFFHIAAQRRETAQRLRDAFVQPAEQAAIKANDALRWRFEYARSSSATDMPSMIRDAVTTFDGEWALFEPRVQAFEGARKEYASATGERRQQLERDIEFFLGLAFCHMFHRWVITRMLYPLACNDAHDVKMYACIRRFMALDWTHVVRAPAPFAPILDVAFKEAMHVTTTAYDAMKQKLEWMRTHRGDPTLRPIAMRHVRAHAAHVLALCTPAPGARPTLEQRTASDRMRHHLIITTNEYNTILQSCRHNRATIGNVILVSRTIGQIRADALPHDCDAFLVRDTTHVVAFEKDVARVADMVAQHRASHDATLRMPHETPSERETFVSECEKAYVSLLAPHLLCVAACEMPTITCELIGSGRTETAVVQRRIVAVHQRHAEAFIRLHECRLENDTLITSYGEWIAATDAAPVVLPAPVQQRVALLDAALASALACAALLRADLARWEDASAARTPAHMSAFRDMHRDWEACREACKKTPLGMNERRTWNMLAVQGHACMMLRNQLVVCRL